MEARQLISILTLNRAKKIKINRNRYRNRLKKKLKILKIKIRAKLKNSLPEKNGRFRKPKRFWLIPG